MSLFVTNTLRESKRMTALLSSYEKQLEALPKGSLCVKERNGKTYYYLTYRCEGRVVSDYIGNEKSITDSLREQLKRRKDVEALIKHIKKELALMNKVLRIAE